MSWKMDKLQEIESHLHDKSYQELNKAMADLPTDTLLGLLGSKSRRVGDTASSLLGRRNEIERVAQAILANVYTRKDARVRAANTLLFGNSDSKTADDALLSLVEDRNEDSADNALVALVALGNPRVIGRLKRLRQISKLSSRMKDKIDLAIEAIEKQDPRVYSPNYRG
jgi:hypothetical protein